MNKDDVIKAINNLYDDKKTIFELIADLYDYIENSDYIDKDYILEKLAGIQSYAK